MYSSACVGSSFKYRRYKRTAVSTGIPGEWMNFYSSNCIIAEVKSPHSSYTLLVVHHNASRSMSREDS